MGDDAAVRGLLIYHPDQLGTAAPVSYPYAIALTGTNSAVLDVELLNAWNGIRAVRAPRHYIARVQGQPINIGILVDETYDIGKSLVYACIHHAPCLPTHKHTRIYAHQCARLQAALKTCTGTLGSLITRFVLCCAEY